MFIYGQFAYLRHICINQATQHGVELDTGVASDSYMRIEPVISSEVEKNFHGLLGETINMIESEFYLYPSVHLREHDC